MIRHTIVLAALLTLAAPVASATEECADHGLAQACVGEWSYAEGCDERDTFDVSSTYAEAKLLAAAEVRAQASEACWWFDDGTGGDDRLQARDVIVEAWTGPASVSLVWSWFERSTSEWTYGECGTFVDAQVGDEYRHENLGCPAGAPPALPYGHLLP